jgi:hypothetical protein
MPCLGFEPTIPAPKRAKAVHALDSSAAVTGQGQHHLSKIWNGLLMLDCRIPVHQNIGSTKFVFGDQTQLRKGSLECAKLPPTPPQIISRNSFMLISLIFCIKHFLSLVLILKILLGHAALKSVT